MGLRSSDRDGIPMTHKCHMDYHGSSGMFRDWGKARKRAWQQTVVDSLRARYPQGDAF